MVAVVGRVGSGKSTLLSGLTGEAIKVGSHSIINIDGSVAYMPQHNGFVGGDWQTKFVYLGNMASNRNSETTFYSSTFNFTY